MIQISTNDTKTLIDKISTSFSDLNSNAQKTQANRILERFTNILPRVRLPNNEKLVVETPIFSVQVLINCV